ncbi:hypothetical protein Tco_0196447 [Tanacetum coccineum]
MPPKAMSQAAIERLITQRVNAAVEVERARQGNAGGQGSNASGTRGQVFHGHEGPVELRRWFEKMEMVFGISESTEGKKVKDFDISAYTQLFHELVQLCPEMVPTKRKKTEAYIWGLTDNIKGTSISSRPTSLNEAVRMAHALMEQKAHARAKRIVEGYKRKWESSQGGNNSNN